MWTFPIDTKITIRNIPTELRSCLDRIHSRFVQRKIFVYITNFHAFKDEPFVLDGSLYSGQLAVPNGPFESWFSLPRFYSYSMTTKEEAKHIWDRDTGDLAPDGIVFGQLSKLYIKSFPLDVMPDLDVARDAFMEGNLQSAKDISKKCLPFVWPLFIALIDREKTRLSAYEK